VRRGDRGRRDAGARGPERQAGRLLQQLRLAEGVEQSLPEPPRGEVRGLGQLRGQVPADEVRGELPELAVAVGDAVERDALGAAQVHPEGRTDVLDDEVGVLLLRVLPVLLVLELRHAASGKVFTRHKVV